MNLIEQYGSYENLKSEYLIAKSMDFRADVLNAFEIALLDYRRANNIFEVGDKVVYKGEAGLDGLFEIERLTKTGKPKTVKTERFGNFPCRYCEVQHATDAEIKAGRRL